MNPRPIIQVEATFLRCEEGGRVQTPDLDPGRYMPHLVVQPPDVRKAVRAGGMIIEDYLPVAFISGPTGYAAGQSGRFDVELMYFPDLRYEGLDEGATFTIREGAKVIGFGIVVARPVTAR